MQLNIGTSMKLEQSQVISPRMIQSMEILQLPVMALQERIEHELGENPVLELKEPGTDQEGAGTGELDDADLAPAAAVVFEPAADTEKELVIDDKGDNEQDFDRLMAINEDWS